MITTIQQETKNAVAVMDEGVKEASRGTTDAEHSGQALQDILGRIDAVTLQVSQIATAAEQQTATTNMQIHTSVTDSALGAGENAIAAANLIGAAEELQALVRRFTI